MAGAPIGSFAAALRAAVLLLPGFGMAALGVAAAGPRNVSVIPPEVIDDACETDNPFLVVTCTNYVEVALDTPDDSRHRHFGVTGIRSSIGAVWGLAYRGSEHAAYAAAFHKRTVRFGPGGPGAIYRIDLASGDVTHFLTVPNAGENHHDPAPDRGDLRGRDWAGKTSLGDIDLRDDGAELYVMNLDDRHIYRFAMPAGTLLGKFPHGAATEPWADDARPWALKYYRGTLYHGVVNSAESTRTRTDLKGVVYASRLDGTDMRQVVAFDFDYARTVDLWSFYYPNPEPDWHPWESPTGDDTRLRVSVRSMPILSDIAFDIDGNMIIGIKDRHADTKFAAGELYTMDKQPALGIGDVLLASPSGEGWSVDNPPDHFGTARSRTEDPLQGGLASLFRTNEVVASGISEVGRGTHLINKARMIWFGNLTGNKLRHEQVCTIVNLPRLGLLDTMHDADRPRDDELYIEVPPGDVEVACKPVLPTPTASALPSTTPTGTAEGRTPTSWPTRTATATSTSTPGSIYLPVLLKEACTPGQQRVDVALVIDASTSMLDPTVAGRTKLDAAKEAAAIFLDQLDAGDQVAIVAFNADAWLWQPLTSDRAVLDEAIAGISAAPQTCIVCAVDVAATALLGDRSDPAHTPVLILLTDGLSNPRPAREAVARAALAKADGVVIFTIGIGSELDFDALEAMASEPAYFYRAPDAEDLGDIYRAIAVEVPCPPEDYWGRRQ